VVGGFAGCHSSREVSGSSYTRVLCLWRYGCCLHDLFLCHWTQTLCCHQFPCPRMSGFIFISPLLPVSIRSLLASSLSACRPEGLTSALSVLLGEFSVRLSPHGARNILSPFPRSRILQCIFCRSQTRPICLGRACGLSWESTNRCLEPLAPDGFGVFRGGTTGVILAAGSGDRASVEDNLVASERKKPLMQLSPKSSVPTIWLESGLVRDSHKNDPAVRK
jgi:hypothetical protein